MTPSTRPRLLLVLLLLLLATAIPLLGWKPWRSGEPAALQTTKEPRKSLSGSAEHSPTRSSSESRSTGTSKAEAKLRSLLEVREGEIAFLRVPPGALEKLMKDNLPRIALQPDEDTSPGFARIPRLEAISNLLLEEVRQGMPVEGQVGTQGGPLSWTNERWQVGGESLPTSEGEVFLNLSMLQEPSEMRLLSTTVSAGSALLLHSAPPDLEGLLLIVGKDRAAGSPNPPTKAAPEGP